MTWIRCTQTVVLIAISASNAAAQFLPPPFIIVQQPGIGLQYGSGKLRFAGFLPIGPYGPSGSARIVVQPLPPASSERLRAPRSDDAYDVTGIDLDVQPASKIWGGKSAPVKKAEAAKIAPPEPKKEVRPEAPPPPAEKKDLRPLGQRLLEDGVAAFRAGEYGVALLRFRQNDGDRAPFLQAQACIAVGKYQDAAKLIYEGLKVQPKWPVADFRPRTELYADQDAAWKAHRKQLEQAQLNEPTNADFLFLLGYLAWFDDQRDIAVFYFQQARAQAADPRWADLFLKAGKVN